MSKVSVSLLLANAKLGKGVTILEVKGSDLQSSIEH
jgi:hypothetical protein